MHLCGLDSEVPYARLENAFVQNFGHFVFVRTNTEMTEHKPSHRMAPDQKKIKKSPYDSKPRNQKKKNVMRKAFLRLTPRKRPQIPNTGSGNIFQFQHNETLNIDCIDSSLHTSLP